MDALQSRSELQQLLDRPLVGTRVTLDEFWAEAASDSDNTDVQSHNHGEVR